EIWDAAWAKFDMMELMEENLGSAPQAVQPMGEPVTQEEVVSLADAVKELHLFFQQSVAKEGPPEEQIPFVPGGHYWSQCAELTADLNAQGVRIWQGEFYFPGSQEKIKGIPRDMVRAANPEESSQAKLKATSKWGGRGGGVVSTGGRGGSWGGTIR
ncbi:hypothetical protein VP01_10125g1, partial [Puccinia sorghi]